MKTGWIKRGVVAVAMCALSQAAMAGSITVYTALEEEEIVDYLAAANAAMPDIEVNVLRLSTGKLGARILAETDNPQVDVIWGWAVTTMMDPRILEMLEPYKAAGSEVLGSAHRAEDNKWFAATGYMGAFCVNTERAKQKGLPIPKTWEDLTDERFKGEILMPNPNASGTGYLHVISSIQNTGGWDQLESLDPNMAQYTSSGSKPCKAARAGEYTVGISLAFTALKSIESGYPIKLVLPEGGVGYELEASALVASSKNKADAKRFLDWTLSDDAKSQYGKYKALVTLPGGGGADKPKPGLPANVTDALTKIDFAESAKSQIEIKKIWKEKFGR